MVAQVNRPFITIKIDCSGVHNSYEGCYKVAAEMCSNGYKVISNQWLMNSGEFVISAISAARAQLRGINDVCQGKMNKAKVF